MTIPREGNWLLRLAALAARLLPENVKQSIYRVKPLARLVRRGLNRAAPEGMGAVTIAGGTLRGARMLLDLQLEKDYWLGTYEPELQRSVRAMVSPGMIAYDVGANIGYISLLLANAVGEQGRVFAFEALPDNLERLRANVRMNALEEVIQVVPAAVIDSPRAVRFLVGPSGGMGKAEGSAGRQGDAHASALEVEGTSLDTFVYEKGYPAPGLVKMDIEGGEVMALPGMRRLLEEHHPLVLLELHGPESAQVAWDVLSGAGYTLSRMQPGYQAVRSPEELDWKAYVVAR